MACNGCYNSFSLLRPEKGCPSCGFSYCSKCLGFKFYIPKLKGEHKVCNNCKKSLLGNDSMKKHHVIPPDAFLKRIAAVSINNDGQSNISSSLIDNEIKDRLNKLKEKNADNAVIEIKSTDVEIAERLQKMKGDVPVASDAELHARLAKLRGKPVIQNKPIIISKDIRTEQEQVEYLMKQYLENVAIDCKYKEEFDSVINVMEARLQKLKEASAQPEASGSQTVPESRPPQESEDEEESVNKIIEKLKAESLKEEEQLGPLTNEELPFCEICNEDAKLRCIGCRYLFCKRCFLDHKDDDDGCDKCEPYTPPKNSN